MSAKADGLEPAATSGRRPLRRQRAQDQADAKHNQPKRGPKRPLGNGFFSRDTSWAWLIVVLLMVVYHLNGEFLPGNDTRPAVYLSLQLLKHQTFVFTPNDAPHMFTWELDTPRGRVVKTVDSWNSVIEGQRAADWKAQGALKLSGARYVLAPVVARGGGGEPRFVSIYGPGSAVIAFPIFAVLVLFKPDILSHPLVAWYAAKTAASLMVAISAALLFLILRRYLQQKWAICLALAYGLGTCVWSASSQALWQHGPASLCLAVGLYFLLHPESRWSRLVLAGFALGAAVACRPTMVFIGLAVAIDLLVRHRKRALPFCLGTMVPVAALVFYNWWYLGTPWNFGQASEVARKLALMKTGNPDPWQTPLWEGIAGLLFSPSRGLLFFSPFFVFVIPGIVEIWRNPRYVEWRALTLGVTAILIVQAKWFDWWGGWGYGYRILVDLSLCLVLFLGAVVPWLSTRRLPAMAFAVLLGWSILFQAVGAFAYDIKSWNALVVGYQVLLPDKMLVTVRDGTQVQRLISEKKAKYLGEVRADIDQPAYRSRIWSLAESQPFFYLSRFSESRRIKRTLLRE